MTLEQLFVQFAQENKLTFHFGFASDNATKSAAFYTTYRGKDYLMHCFFVEEEHMLVVSADSGVLLEGTLDQLRTLNELNAKSKICAFFQDDLTDHILVKSSQILLGDAQSQYEILTRQIYLTAMTASSGAEYLEA